MDERCTNEATLRDYGINNDMIRQASSAQESACSICSFNLSRRGTMKRPSFTEWLISVGVIQKYM